MKYRQHGYNDRDQKPQRSEGGGAKSGGEKSGGEKSAPRPKHDFAFGPRPVNLPGTRQLSRCTQCGTVQPTPAGEKCLKCGFELHSCKQCSYFDPGSRFECLQPIKERIAKKDVRNECTLYEIRVTREKETSTPVAARPATAREAFDNLFKK